MNFGGEMDDYATQCVQILYNRYKSDQEIALQDDNRSPNQAIDSEIAHGIDLDTICTASLESLKETKEFFFKFLIPFFDKLYEKGY